MLRLRDGQKLIGLLLLVLGAWLAVRLSPVLSPLLIALLLAYLALPAVSWLQRRGLSHRVAVCVAYLPLLALVMLAGLFLVPVLGQQLARLLASVPPALGWLEGQTIPALEIRNGLGYLILIPVASFYLLQDWDALVRGLVRLMPERARPVATDLAGRADRILAVFTRRQLPVLVILAAVYALGLTVIGLEYGLLIGVVAGLASIVRYLGPILGLVAALASALMPYQGPVVVLAVIALFFVGHFLARVVLVPRLVGLRRGLHPLLVILALLVGGQLLGLLGVLLAVPVAALVLALRDRPVARPRHPLDAEGRPVEYTPAPDDYPDSVDESMRQEDA